MEADSPIRALNQIYSAKKLEVDESDYPEFEKKVYFLKRLAEVENSSVTVLDFNSKKYIFTRSRYIERLDNAFIDHDVQDPF
jgi:hypothetical protein